MQSSFASLQKFSLKLHTFLVTHWIGPHFLLLPLILFLYSCSVFWWNLIPYPFSFEPWHCLLFHLLLLVHSSKVIEIIVIPSFIFYFLLISFVDLTPCIYFSSTYIKHITCWYMLSLKIQNHSFLPCAEPYKHPFNLFFPSFSSPFSKNHFLFPGSTVTGLSHRHQWSVSDGDG